MSFFEPVVRAIELAMQARNLSQRDVAWIAGVAPSTVGRVLKRENVRMSSLVRVSKAVGVSWEIVGTE